MKALCLFGCLRMPPKHAVLRNALHLAAANKCGLSILIDAYTRSFDRSYIELLGYNDNHRKQLWEYISEYIESTYKQLHALCEEDELEAEISVDCMQTQEWEKVLLQVLQSCRSDWLLLDYSSKQDLHPIFRKLAKLPTSILLMRNQKWKQQPVIVAAIDPLHQHDRPAIMEKKIIQVSGALSSSLKTKYKIVHCYYVTPLLLKYASQMKATHSESINDFCLKNQIDRSIVSLVSGNPEIKIPEFTKNYACDILVIGGYCRSSLSDFWLGSTTEVIVQSKPCDIMLVKAGLIKE